MPKKGSKSKGKASKAPAPAPAAPKENPLYPNAPRNNRIGGAVRVRSGPATAAMTEIVWCSGEPTPR